MEAKSKYEEYVATEDFEDKNSDGIKHKFVKFIESPWWFGAVVLLVVITSFSLGRLSALRDGREPVRVINTNSNLDVKDSISNIEQTASIINSGGNGSVVASKNGTKYHYPWCAGAKQISPKNIITFDSTESARAAGYTPASNCKGLK